MVFSTTWLESKDIAQDPLVRREPVSASCNQLPDEGLETQKYSLYPKEHPANWWRLSNGLGVYLSWLQVGFSHHTRQPNWWSVHQRPVVVPHFDNHPLATRSVYMNDNARPHRSRAATAYLQSEAVTSVHWPAMSTDLNPIEHIWDMYTGSRTSCAKHSSVGSNIASGMAAAITTGHPTSNWRDETQGWGRHPNLWGYTRYWTLNNRCRQVIHTWRFESEMTILSCFFNCEGQYLSWTCFTAKGA